jgi:3D (Asp-Asp-Asp) domain-containing protein
MESFSLCLPRCFHASPRVFFWATDYFRYKATDTAGEVPLLDLDDKPLGVTVSRRVYCHGAMEGTLVAGGITYNYAGIRKTNYVDCSEYFPHRLGYTRFRKATGPFGDGTEGYILIPYRTIAADPAWLPLGSVLFIPEAVGHILPTGVAHDGFFFVADIGGAIRGNHIDIFNGDEVANFPFVGSSPSSLYEAYLIGDDSISKILSIQHLPNPQSI